jgi:hypothetical protein
MPQFNTSLDRFYKTTAHWDPWKQYRELINDENVNSVKSQVIKREFNGVKQFQEEKKRLTEGDKLVLVDINKNIEKFKQSITTATSNLLDGKKKPLNDLFFNFNSLMVAYNNLIQTSGRNLISQSVLADIKNKLESTLPTLRSLEDKINSFIFMTESEEGQSVRKDQEDIIDYLEHNDEMVFTLVSLQALIDLIQNNEFGKRLDIDKDSVEVSKRFIDRMNRQGVQALSEEAELAERRRIDAVFSDFDRRIRNGERLKRNEGAVGYDATGQNDKDLTAYEEELKRLSEVQTAEQFRRQNAEIARSRAFRLNERLFGTDRAWELQYEMYRRTAPDRHHLNDSDFARSDLEKARDRDIWHPENYAQDARDRDVWHPENYAQDEQNRGRGRRGGAVKIDAVEQLKNKLQKLYYKRNGYIKESTNKNLDKIQYEKLNHNIHKLNKEIQLNADLLTNTTRFELEAILNKEQAKLSGEPNKVAPPGFQFVIDPSTGQSVLKPVKPEEQKKKEDIQPSINNAQQIIADETMVYNKKLAGTASEDELKVKQDASTNAIIPLFKAIFKVKPDEVQALHSNIADPVWKLMLLERMPEINRPHDVIPDRPVPKPDDKPIEPPPPPPDQPPEKKPIVVKDLQDRINQQINQINEVYADDVVNPRTKIAVFCNKILDILEEGRFNGLDVKGNLSLEELGGSISKKAIKDELWDDFTKGVRWDQGADVKVPTPAEFSQELVKLVNKVLGHEDDLDIMEEEKGTLSESTIFNTLRPDINEVIKYLIKGRKWYNNDIRQYKEYLVNALKPKSQIGNQTPVSKAYAKLADSIYKHATEESMFDDQGETNQREPDLPPAPSGAVFNSQLKSLVSQLNGTIDNWNAGADDRNLPEQNTAHFYPVILNDVNKLIDKYHERDRYEAQGSFDRSFRNDMDNQLNSILPAEPKSKNLTNDLKQKILDHAKDNTKFTVGGRRGRPAGGRKINKVVAYEYKRANEFGKKSFRGLKMPIAGVVRVDKVVPHFHFKNPGLGRVNKYTEGSGVKLDLLSKSNAEKKRQDLINSLIKKGKGKIDIEIDTSDSESDDEVCGAGRKQDLIEFYTNPYTKNVMKLITAKGKQLLKKTINRLLDDYSEDYKLNEEYYIIYLLQQVLIHHSDVTPEADSLADELSDLGLESSTPNVEEMEDFIIKNLKINKPKEYDEEEGFTDLEKPKSGRRARGKGKEEDKKLWVDFFDSFISRLYKGLSSKKKKVVKKYYLHLTNKYPKKYHEYIKLELIVLIMGSFTTEEDENEWSKRIDEQNEELNDDSDELLEINRYIEDIVENGIKDIIIALGKKKMGGRKKVGHKKKKPSFTEI